MSLDSGFVSLSCGSMDGRRARRKQALQRVALAQIPVPALCACGLTIFADRAQTASCTARCLFYRDPEAFDSAVDNFLYSLEQCL